MPKTKEKIQYLDNKQSETLSKIKVDMKAIRDRLQAISQKPTEMRAASA